MTVLLALLECVLAEDKAIWASVVRTRPNQTKIRPCGDRQITTSSHNFTINNASTTICINSPPTVISASFACYGTSMENIRISGFWLGQPEVSVREKLPEWSLRSFRWTSALDTHAGSESVPHKSAFPLFSLSLDTVIVGEVNELEEDVRWSISYFESVMNVEEGELEEELADKPRTTNGKKFVLQCIRIPFLMRYGFWPMFHS